MTIFTLGDRVRVNNQSSLDGFEGTIVDGSQTSLSGFTVRSFDGRTSHTFHAKALRLL